MADLDAVGALVAAVGPRVPDVEGVLQRAEDEWLVRLPDLDIALEYDAGLDRLGLTVELEEPRPEHRLTVYTALLQYALLWRDTGGVSVALTAENRPILLLTLHGGELTEDLLTAVLANLTTKARVLRSYVAQGGEEPIATDALATFGIRI